MHEYDETPSFRKSVFIFRKIEPLKIAKKKKNSYMFICLVRNQTSGLVLSVSYIASYIFMNLGII